MRGSITIAAPPARAELLHRCAQDLLGVGLDLMIDRERRRSCRGARARRDDVDRAAERILDDRLEAGPARERLVERPLEPVEAVVVRAGEAEDVRGDCALRIRAQLLGVETEPGDVAACSAPPPCADRPCAPRRRTLRSVLQVRVEHVRVEAERLAARRSRRAWRRRCSAGRRRRSLPARRSRAARPYGRRSCLARPGPRSSRGAG